MKEALVHQNQNQQNEGNTVIKGNNKQKVETELIQYY